MIIENSENIKKVDQNLINKKIDELDEKKNITPQKPTGNKDDRLELSSDAMTLKKLTE